MTAVERGGGVTCRPSWRIGGGLALTALAVFLSGCCFAKLEPTYSFEIVPHNYREIDIDWADELPTLLGSEGAVPIRIIQVRFGIHGVALRETELLEIYASLDGTARVPSPGTVRRDFVESGSCAFDLVEYDISTLAPGRYLLVHRRSSAPEGFDYYVEADWTTFEGEDALVTTLVVSPR
jgi:hypothetical protein